MSGSKTPQEVDAQATRSSSEFQMMHARNDATLQSNFLQTREFLEVRAALGWQPVEFHSKYGEFYGSFGGGRFKYLDILMGAILDYSSPETVQKFTDEIRREAKKLGATYVRMNPNVVRAVLSATGERFPRHCEHLRKECVAIPESNFYQRECSELGDTAITNLKHAGWCHDGLTVGSEGSPRFLFVKNLTVDGSANGALMSREQLFASVRKGHQNCLKKAQAAGVTLRNLTYDELPLFKAVTEQTGDRRGYQDKSLEYYQAFYNAFCGDGAKGAPEAANGARPSAQFRVAEIDPKLYVGTIQNEVDKWQAEVDKNQAKVAGGQKKAQGQLNNAIEIRDAAIRRLEQAKTWESDVPSSGKLIVAASIFIEYSGIKSTPSPTVPPLQERGIQPIISDSPTEMVYFLSGMIDKYRDLFAPHLLQYDIMLQCLERGIKRYNFYGVDGIFDGTSPETGVLNFKQGFGAKPTDCFVEELIGQFELPVNKPKYALYQGMKKLR